MKFESSDDPPEDVRHVLPMHAQEVFRAAFNNAWDEYVDPTDRRGV